MRISFAFMISILLVFTLIIGVVLSASYLDDTASYIISEMDNLHFGSDSASEDILRLQAYWESRRRILDLTVSKQSLDTVSLLFDEILISVNEDDEFEYRITTARLRRAVENINQLEKISPSNIF